MEENVKSIKALKKTISLGNSLLLLYIKMVSSGNGSITTTRQKDDSK